jgi:hypothetical protein
LWETVLSRSLAEGFKRGIKTSSAKLSRAWGLLNMWTTQKPAKLDIEIVKRLDIKVRAGLYTVKACFFQLSAQTDCERRERKLFLQLHKNS